MEPRGQSLLHMCTKKSAAFLLSDQNCLQAFILNAESLFKKFNKTSALVPSVRRNKSISGYQKIFHKQSQGVKRLFLHSFARYLCFGHS